MSDLDTPSDTNGGLDLSPIFAALEHPLALIDDPSRREDARRLFEASRLHQERAIIDLLSDVIARVNQSTTDVRVRLEYGSRQFTVAVDSLNTTEEPSDPMVRMDGDLEKVTIRLPKVLKDLIDEGVRDQGVSLNSWYVRALARSIRHDRHHGRGGGDDRTRGMFGGGRRGRRGGPFREDPA